MIRAGVLLLAVYGCAVEPTTPVEVCDNRLDDDGDGATDCLDADCLGQCPELCGDALDNDGDGLIDCLDADCDGLCPERCDDDRDNDGDGMADCHDLDCIGSCPEACDDGFDNDGDGFIDCLDADCDGLCPEFCDDGRDNDGDELIDCLDVDCDGACPEVCDDGRDNDGDGLLDCLDPDCAGGCPEACLDRLDNDGDGLLDCDDPDCWSTCDADDDGFLGTAVEGTDCDDLDAEVHPGATEICNGKDDDCDGPLDDEDPDVDPATYTAWYADSDGDGYGHPTRREFACDPLPGSVGDRTDCDDQDPAVNPGATEICNDGVDDDCNMLSDDDDPGLDVSTATTWHLDADADGYGDAALPWMACLQPLDHVADGTDCDDADPWLGPPTLWLLDEDGDGHGAGTAVGPFGCVPPSGQHVPMSLGIDCDDAAIDVNPGAPELCGDGVDQDCDGLDRPCTTTCKILQDIDPSASSGTYVLWLDDVPYDGYCDFDTDGGGWTLVGSSTSAFRDEASAHYDDLTTLTPGSDHDGIWSGMRSVIAGNSDIRFACKVQVEDAFFTVDLSFYDIHWYREITTGADVDSCFNEDNGLGADPPPRRRNNLTGAELAAGNPWNYGYFEGEDYCSSTDDFTVDFDDRGMDSNQTDGTDWGMDDSTKKCGSSYPSGGAWFLFVREP